MEHHQDRQESRGSSQGGSGAVAAGAPGADAVTGTGHPIRIGVRDPEDSWALV